MNAEATVPGLIVVRAGKTRGANHNLSFPVPVACSARPFTHRGQSLPTLGQRYSISCSF
jgi:hypothetical protein